MFRFEPQTTMYVITGGIKKWFSRRIPIKLKNLEVNKNNPAFPSKSSTALCLQEYQLCYSRTKLHSELDFQSLPLEIAMRTLE